jgi:hypothetical protein
MEFLAPRPTTNLEDKCCPLTCLSWVTLPGAYAPASIALGVIRGSKSPHPQHVLRQSGSPWGGKEALGGKKNRTDDGVKLFVQR